MEEINGEKLGGLGTASKDIVDDVVVLMRRWGLQRPLDEFGCIIDGGRVVGGEVEILLGKLDHNRVELDDCSINAVFHECTGGCANSKTTISRSLAVTLRMRKQILT